MTALAYLIPISLILGSLGLVFFVWTLRADQYDDPQGNAERILDDSFDDKPKRLGVRPKT